MRRYLFLILFVLVLGTPFLLRHLVGGAEQESSHRNAPRRVVIITPHTEGIRREFQEGFSKWLALRGEPDVFLDYRSFGGGASDIVKYFENSKDLYNSIGTYNVDIVWGGGDFLFEQQLKKPGYLEQTKLPDEVMKGAFPSADISGVPLYDKDGYWYGTALSSFGIVYNKDVLRYLGLPEPKTWADLTDPRYRGWIVMADPTRSASARTAFMAVVEKAMADAEKDPPPAGRPRGANNRGGATRPATRVGATSRLSTRPAGNRGNSNAIPVGTLAADIGWARGMGLVRLICSNARVFADASASVPAMVGRGDAAAGMSIDFYGRTQVEFVGESHLGYVEPVGATVVNPDPIAIVRVDKKKGVEVNPAALKFVEFVLSEDGQKLMNYRVGTPGGPKSTALRRLPIRRGLYDDTSNFSDKVNPFTIAGSFNTNPERTKTFPILGEMIQVSCIDLQSELREARKAILASPNREEMEKSFAVFPFRQTEALKRMKEYKEATPLKKLELLRQWTNEFRQQYERIDEMTED